MNQARPNILQLNPILVPAINAALDARYTMHRLFEQRTRTRIFARTARRFAA